jgi:hypothetical protein
MTVPSLPPIGPESVARWWLLTAIPGVIVSVLLIVLLNGAFEPDAVAPPPVPAGPAGTQSFTGLQRNHVPGDVHYAQTPPVGGNHAPIWENCGVYRKPIPNVLGVHSLEHGSVWVTYDADALSPDQITRLEHLVQRHYASAQRYVLLSPYKGLPTPVVASAWGRQLRLSDPNDPRLGQFLDDFVAGPQTPEPGNPCFQGGLGVPVDAALG